MVQSRVHKSSRTGPLVRFGVLIFPFFLEPVQPGLNRAEPRTEWGVPIVEAHFRALSLIVPPLFFSRLKSLRRFIFSFFSLYWLSVRIGLLGQHFFVHHQHRSSVYLTQDLPATNPPQRPIINLRRSDLQHSLLSSCPSRILAVQSTLVSRHIFRL
jgi:hypothetical protein